MPASDEAIAAAAKQVRPKRDLGVDLPELDPRRVAESRWLRDLGYR